MKDFLSILKGLFVFLLLTLGNVIHYVSYVAVVLTDIGDNLAYQHGLHFC